MKGLILSGGTGSRIRPFSLYTAKQLLPVLNKPVLFHNIDLLLAGGIEEIGIVVGPMKKFVHEAIENSDYRKKANISLIEQLEPKGLAHAVFKSRYFLKDDNFIMILGDNYFAVDTINLIDTFKKNNAASLVALVQVKESTRYGLAVIEEEKVIRVMEKPKVPLSNWALAGLYIFTPIIHEIIKNLTPSFRNEYEITDAIQEVIKQHQKVIPYYLHGYWRDIGTLQDLWQANMDLLQEGFNMEGNLQTSSMFIPPVIVDKTANISNSIIGPNVTVCPEAVIKNSHIKNSIILEKTSINNYQGENTIFSPWGNKEVEFN